MHEDDPVAEDRPDVDAHSADRPDVDAHSADRDHVDAHSADRDHVDAERVVRDRLDVVLADVTFPVDDPLQVAAAVDAPHSQRIRVGDRSFTAMALAVRLEPYQDFPYESLDALVDDVVLGLREEALL